MVIYHVLALLFNKTQPRPNPLYVLLVPLCSRVRNILAKIIPSNSSLLFVFLDDPIPIEFSRFFRLSDVGARFRFLLKGWYNLHRTTVRSDLQFLPNQY